MDHENHPNRPPSEQMVDLHVYVVPPALWQERLHSAFNQIIGETVSAGFIRVFPESLLQQVRSDIERQLGYEIVPRNFVFCKSVGRCLTQVRSRQEKELKAKHFLPPHAYCPEMFVLDYDIARRSQSSSDGSIASNRSYPNHHSLLQQQPPQSRQRPPLQQPPQLQSFDSPRQTQRSKHHQRLSETTVYHGRTPKVAHKGVTGVYIGPYPMQSYPGLGSRPGTADSQSRSPVPFDSGLEIDYEELDSKARVEAVSAAAQADADSDDAFKPPPPPPFDESPRAEPTPAASERTVSGATYRLSTGRQEPHGGSAEPAVSAADPDEGSAERNHSNNLHSSTTTPLPTTASARSVGRHLDDAEDDRLAAMSAQALLEEMRRQRRLWEAEKMRVGAEAPAKATEVPAAQAESAEVSNGMLKAKLLEFERLQREEEERNRRLKELEQMEDQIRRQIKDAELALADRVRKAEEEEERRRREEEERRKREEEERRRLEEEERRGREDEERRKREDEERRKREDEERRKREDEERRKREDEERRKREDEERRKREDEERRKREDEERRRRQEKEELQRRLEEEERRRRLEEEERRRRQEEEDERRWLEEEAERQRLAEEEAERRRREEEENEIDGMVPSLLIEEATSIDPQEEMRRGREQLLSELQRVRDDRAEIERRRDDLIRRARQLQSRTQNMRNQARDMWKKRYFEEKKLTTPLEDQANRLRDELEVYHKRMVSSMTSRVKEGKNIDTPDATQQLNLRIQATRMQHEIEELQRRVDDSKMKLTAEVKLRTQAEAELRAMKAELTQRKLNLSMTRTQQMGQMVS